MPEGHTIHRAARTQAALLAGRPLAASSPQGRFADGAARLDGRVLERIDAHGKHLLYRFRDAPALHVHLGLFGRFRVHRGEVPPPRATTRLRLAPRDADDLAVDLSGPTACELFEPPAEERLMARLGPDPLARDADPGAFLARVRRSRAPVGTLLMDQSVLAGVGNVFRAEALFLCGVHPLREGRDLTGAEADCLWRTAGRMLEDGVRPGRIVTVDPAEAGAPWSRIPRARRTYVYGRDSCLRCGTPVERLALAGRTAFACPHCQPR
ncbi:MAG TPA: DNA-formamidopyrimidine glycosylase family protein [Miltoncostaeaceae bacterium]|nr:DNA-formamidopyrimidine glycosylase family protein [Miltoncostaeaceae bacterium]